MIDLDFDDIKSPSSLFSNTVSHPISLLFPKIEVKLEFNEPHTRCCGEKKSKLLRKDSNLYNHIIKLKNILRLNGFNHQDRMDLHVEVLNINTEPIEEFIKRVNLLEGQIVDINDPKIYSICGRSVALLLGNVEGYNGIAKITIIFIDDNDKIKAALKCILENI